MAKQPDTRTRLVETMLNLMWQHGYAGVSVDKVCKAAGVNKGSFYHFFPSKEDLALAALDLGWEGAKTGLYAESFDPALPPLERLNRLVEMIHGFHTGMIAGEWQAEQGCPFGNIGAESGVDDARIREKVREIYEEEAAFFEATLADAVEDGAIPPCDAAETARLLVALQSGMFQHAKIYEDTDWIARFIPAAAGIIGAEVEDGRFAVPETAGTG